MSDFDDLRLSKATEETEATPPPPPQPRWLLILVAIVMLAALVAVWFYLRRGSELDRVDAGTGQTPQRSEARPLGEPGADIALPPLDASDSLVRDLVRALSEHPTVAAWLTTDQLIRNFTIVVVNIANGETPSGHLHTVAPDGSFQTRQQNGTTYIDPASHARFDRHASAVAAVDPRGAARLYATLKPRIDEAYREVAGPDADFDRTLQRAIVELLRTPVLDGEAALEPAAQVGYAYRDAALESLSGAQRQLLRMGPRNVRLVQEKLRAIAGHLGIDEASLPRERVVRPAG
jgi:hypothetical protein